MTSVFGPQGENIACTVIEAGPCVVTQVRNVETDGYRSVQLAFGEKKEKHTTKALLGHFKKASTTPKAKVVEFRDFRAEFDGVAELGKEIRVPITCARKKGQGRLLRLVVRPMEAE